MEDGIDETLRDEPIDQIDRSEEASAAIDQRLDKTLQALSAGISRLERKLDRILALATESRARLR